MSAPVPQRSLEMSWLENLHWTYDLIDRNLFVSEGSVDSATRKKILEIALSECKSSFLNWLPSARPSDPRDLIKGIVSLTVLEHNLISHLPDEELVRLALAGYKQSGDKLAIRYLPKIKKTVASIVRAKHLCQFSDVDAFIEDISSDVALKLVTKLHTYRFKKPLEHWVNVISKRAAYTAGRKVVGRGKGGPRKYVSVDEFLHYDPRVVEPEHRDILQRIFEAHGKRGKRGRRSNQAIHLSSFEGLNAKEVAKQLRTTPAYVNGLISHDYRLLREISIDEFGFTGKDI